MPGEKIYDLIIIGAGPAGITAGIYAARKKMDCLIVTVDVGGQAAWSGDIENYTGYQFISGTELVAKFEEHVRNYKIDIRENEEVRELEKRSDTAWISTDKNKYAARTVIIASGKRSKELGAPGEAEFKNRGLTYCATCDAPLFEGKDVVIAGGGNSALDAALQLVKIAKKIYVINITPELDGDAVMCEKVIADSKVTVFNNSEVTEIFGDKFVEGIKFKKEGKEGTLSVQGVFVEIGLIPNSEFIKDIDKNELGEIRVNCQTETNVPGVFAAGDVTSVMEKQIIIAAGEGSKATLRAFRYLAERKYR